MNRRTAALGLAAALTIASCGAQGAASPAPPPRYTAGVTVLEGGGHGPQLCQAVMESLPPQCGGPDVIGWDWSKVKHESLRGVKWGEYRVVGTWDGARLTLTEPPGAPVKSDPAGENTLASPCPEPEGGWRPVDPAKATQETLEEAMARARTAKEFAGAWLDQSYMDQAKLSPEEVEKQGNDPKRLVLNLKFTGDLAGREEWIRQVWGGALCVSGAQRTEAELNEIQRQVEGEMGSGGLITASSSVTRNRVEVSTWLATEDLRRRIDEKYGPDAVVFDSVLKPVE
ncbi:hypothetical protein [Nonomuraea basaltis]|uniref:hypothetical protein n=1 Tax=Nonomuraea basaltis TaxID=2495887 RepID=UPI00110C6C97|nr:hypothetical protein [Nonomuraea basaltis]TMR95368.1 hypothetical protein EJK15_28710 [Nonomuraea basaltis]